MKRTVGFCLEIQVSLKKGQSQNAVLDTLIGDLLERYDWVDGVVLRGTEVYEEGGRS